MKPANVVDAIADFLISMSGSIGKVHVSGNLPSLDPRFSDFLEATPEATYRHSSMPLLALQFQFPLVIEVHSREFLKRFVILTLRLYHDALWFSGSRTSGEFHKIKYPELEKFSLTDATEVEKQQNDVENFLDGL